MVSVADLHKLEPLADVYEFDPAKQYVIYVPRSMGIQSFIKSGRSLGIRAQIIVVEDPREIVMGSHG